MGYDKNIFDSEKIRSLGSRLFRRKLISPEQLTEIYKANHTRFYTPNLFVRIGLFIFTLILVNAGLGIFGLFLVEALNNEMAFGILCLFASAGITAALEMFTGAKHHFRSGIDDCLLYMAVAFAIAGFAIILGLSNVKPILFVAILILTIASWRYLDLLLAILAFAVVLALTFLVLSDFTVGKMIMPFLFFILSALVTWMASRYYEDDKYIYWSHSLKALRVTGLLVMYLSLNYLVVREGNRMLNQGDASYTAGKEFTDIQAKIDHNYEIINNSYSDSTKTITDAEINRLTAENDSLYQQLGEMNRIELSKIAARGIPMSWLFIAATLLIPFLYIYFGLRKKDRMLLWSGLSVLVLSVLTYKYYIHLVPMEYTITIAGLVLLAVSWFAIRYLKKNNSIYTYAPDEEDNSNELLNAEALIIAQTFYGGAPSTPAKGTDFGGGSFGGGGAGGTI